MKRRPRMPGVKRAPRRQRADGYVLTLVSETGEEVPANFRMRELLKRLLRAHGFRCVRIEPLNED